MRGPRIGLAVSVATVFGISSTQFDPKIIRGAHETIAYCSMDYVGYINFFLPCASVPVLTPRKTPRATRGEFGFFIDLGQDI